MSALSVKEISAFFSNTYPISDHEVLAGSAYRVVHSLQNFNYQDEYDVRFLFDCQTMRRSIHTCS